MALSELERRLCDRIASRRDALLRDLAEHVAIPTGRNHRPGLERYRTLLANRFTALGAEIKLVPGEPRPSWIDPSSRKEAIEGGIPPTMIACSISGRPSPRILLAGHLDTVHDPQGPFRELTVEPDGLTAAGPGCADMKGGIVVALAALEALHDAGVELNWSFLLNSDEETGSFHSAATIRRIAQEHEIGIAVEPALADGSLAIERMGSGQFMIEVFGRSAHVGREFTRGVSAVTRLGELLVTLAGMADPERGMIVNVGPLEGGSVTNAVPDHAACWGNARFADAEAGETLGRKIDALATADDAVPRMVVHRSWNRPAKPCNDRVRALAEAARAVAEDIGPVHRGLPFASTGGVCDGNNLQDAGLPTIDTLGVRGGNLHRTDEFIEIASLADRCQLLAVLLMRLAEGWAI